LLPGPVEAAQLYMRLLLSSMAASYPAEVYEHIRAEAAKLDADDVSLAAERFRGSVLSHRDWLAADQMRAGHRHQWGQLFTEFDIVLCPATPTPAFPHDHSPDQWGCRIIIDGGLYDYPDQLVWAGIATTPGLPATVAPIGQSDEGLPIGAQLIGPMFEDHTPIRFAELIETEFRTFTAPPLP
jgi:amidase